MICIAAVLGGIGLTCALTRRTLLGVLIGLQLMILGASTAFVIAGVGSGAPVKGQVFAFVLSVGALSQLVVGFALAVRLFYLRKRVGMDELRTLKR
jgi:NADH:ubiquinone oxidoreductase subunit K